MNGTHEISNSFFVRTGFSFFVQQLGLQFFVLVNASVHLHLQVLRLRSLNFEHFLEVEQLLLKRFDLLLLGLEASLHFLCSVGEYLLRFLKVLDFEFLTVQFRLFFLQILLNVLLHIFQHRNFI